MITRLPLDLKSLYLNIKNDNLTGHTPTVATPLRQGNSVHAEIAQIMNLPSNISDKSFDELSFQLLSKSRAKAKIVKAFVFDNISVNGIPVKANCSYCIYVREEIDPENVHCGRQKVHYPQVLHYEDEDITIDNRIVIREVSRLLHDYAFIVQAFEYDDEKSVLNFDALIVGENDIPYSKVFLNKRGVGDKFSYVFNEYADIYDTEIIALRKALGYENVRPDNFMEIMNENKSKALQLIQKQLERGKEAIINDVQKQYPYSVYDFEVIVDGIKEYAIVRFTATNRRYFNLSKNCIRFITNFQDQVYLYLVNNINGTPLVRRYSASELFEMRKTIESVTYEAEEE